MVPARRLLVAILVLAGIAGCGPQRPVAPDDPVAEAPDPPAPSELAGTEWLATAIEGERVSSEARFTIAFDATGRVTGTSGCNRFFGAYSVEGEAIALGHLGATQMVCPPEEMEQEQRFLDLLARSERFELAGGTLVLSTGQASQVVTMVKLEPSPLVSGIVLYSERMALPPDAVLTVRLVDLQTGGAIGEEIIQPTGQVPIPFAIGYDPAQIDDRSSYAVQARIDAGGSLLFASTRALPVITDGHPTRDVEIIVARAEPAPEAPAGD